MKAKEYASMIVLHGYAPEIFHQLAKSLISEVITITTERNCQTASAMNSVFKEIDQKYQAICTIINKDQPTPIMQRSGFKEVVKEVYKDAKFLNELEFFK